MAQLLNDVPLAVNIPHYAGKLREKTILRDLITAGHRIVQSAYEPQVKADEALDSAQRRILKIETGSTDSAAVPVKMLIEEAQDRYQTLFEHKGKITGISSGFEALDRLTAGFHPSDLIIIAARPSMGKTAFALNTAANMGRQGRPVLFFSLEMSKRQLIDRLVSAEAAVNGIKFKTGSFSAEDWQAIEKASGRVYSWPVFIDDTSILRHMEIIRRSRRAKKTHGIEAVFIDYLQYVTGDQGQGKNYEVESITRGLKGLAKDLNIPVLLLSQLNRQCETRPNPYKRPQLSDLRDSGAIEQDADLVLFLYRPERYGEKDAHGNEQPGIAEVNIAKHRNGPLGTVTLNWQERITRFDNLIRQAV